MVVHINCELTVLVPNSKRGKSYIGRTPFEVCVFKSEEQWNYLTSEGQEKELPRKTLVARFSTYGDAYGYAVRLKESAMYYRVLLRS